MTQSEPSLIASMRDWALDPSGVCFVLRGANGSVAIFKDDIDSRDDGNLLRFVQMRCGE